MNNTKGPVELTTWPARVVSLQRAIAEIEASALRAKTRSEIESCRLRRGMLLRELAAAKAGAMNDDFGSSAPAS
jgi:hypothetical protein